MVEAQKVELTLTPPETHAPTHSMKFVLLNFLINCTGALGSSHQPANTRHVASSDAWSGVPSGSTWTHKRIIPPLNHAAHAHASIVIAYRGEPP
jgi:hypothetical protein